MQQLRNSVPVFFDSEGRLLTGGFIYVGAADADPVANPVQLYWDEALSIPAAQPLRTIAGLIVNGTEPAAVFLQVNDYSQLVADVQGVQVSYSPSVFVSQISFQPLDSDLTAIAAIGTAPFGRSLLALTSQNDLRNATGIPVPLPAAGGTVTGNVTRQGAGTHLYWVDPTLSSGRVFFTAKGAADPTSQPGDIWFEADA